MTKKKIAHAVAERLQVTDLLAQAAVNATIEIMGKALAEGQRIELRGFGVFEPVTRPARIVRNPKTNERFLYPAKKDIKFKVSDIIQDEQDRAEGR